MRLQDKVAIITGSASGMGYTEAIKFAEEGAKVIVADINLDNATKVANEIQNKGGQAYACKVDVTKTEDIQNCVEFTNEKFGPVDILVNNAGIFDKYATVLETSKEQWNTIMAINLTSVYEFSKAVLPSMIERKTGAIVNIASVAGLVAAKGGAAYTASKHGVIGLTKHMASEYSKYGIKINAVCPGTINTPLIKDIKDKIPKDPIPARTFGKPEEVASLVVFLASDEAKFMTGSIVPIDGGFTIQ